MVASGAVTMSDRTSVISPRDAAGFRAAVREKFSSLEALGFRPLESDESLVRFAGRGVEVVIFHDRQSYELVLEFRFDGESFSLSEILRAARPPKTDYRRWAAETQQGVAHGLDQLAGLLQRFGRDALDGSPDFIERLRRQREEWSRSLAMDVRVSQTKPKADDAFRRGEYQEAARLYAQIEDALSETEKSKLAIARRKAAEMSDSKEK
jgi:hypothetical protein